MPELRRLQRDLADLILAPEPPPHPFDGHREALLVYRDLARQGLTEPLEAQFPVTRALLGAAWDPCVDAFLEARAVASRHYRDIAPAFLGWLAATGTLQDRWPALLALVHFELLESLVERYPDGPAEPGLTAAPDLAAQVALAPATRAVSYAHRVHLATEEAPDPAPGVTHLLAFRSPEGRFALRELTEATAALLVRAGAEPLGAVLAGLGGLDPDAAFALLEELRAAGAVAGYRLPR